MIGIQIKQLINFFVGKCGGYQIFFVYLQRFLKSIAGKRPKTN